MTRFAKKKLAILRTFLVKHTKPSQPLQTMPYQKFKKNSKRCAFKYDKVYKYIW